MQQLEIIPDSENNVKFCFTLYFSCDNIVYINEIFMKTSQLVCGCLLSECGNVLCVAV